MVYYKQQYLQDQNNYACECLHWLFAVYVQNDIVFF